MILLKEIFANENLIKSLISNDQMLIEQFSDNLVSTSIELSNIVQCFNDMNTFLFSSGNQLNSLYNSSIPSSIEVDTSSGKKLLNDTLSGKAVSNSHIANELNKLIEQITDYANQLSHYSQEFSKPLHKSRNEYESSLQKFLSTPKKKRQNIAGTLVDHKMNFMKATADIHRFYSKVILDMNAIGLRISNCVSAVLSAKPFQPIDLSIETIKSAAEPEDLTNEIKIYKMNLGLIPLTEDVVSTELNKGLKKGYLWKRSKGPRKNWTRRYFYVNENQLCTKNGTTNTVVIDDVASCTFNESETDDRPYVFECNVSPGNTIYFQAEGELELKVWLLVFQQIKSEVNKIPTSSQKTIPSAPLSPAPILADEISGRTKWFTHSAEDLVQVSDAKLSDSIGNLSLSEAKTGGDSSPRYNRRKGDDSQQISTEVFITGPLAMKESKVSRRPSLTYRDFSHILWRTSTFTIKESKLFTVQSHALNTQKELLDLKKQVMNRHYIQECDESLFNRKYVFSITSTNGQIFFFAANSSNERQRWVQGLKIACHGWHHGADGLPYRVYRSLSLRIIEGRNLTNDVYCEIYVGSDLKARTPSRKAPEYFWRNDYLFSDTYSMRHGVTVVVMNQSRMRDVELGRIVITQQMLKGGETEAWYPIVSEGGSSLFSGNNGNIGDLKIRFKYSEEVVLSMDQYQPLIDILEITNPIVYDLANAASDLEAISSLLLYIHDAKGESIEWLKFLIAEEIERTDDANVLFRGNSILTKAMDAYMKLVGMEYLEKVLGNVLREIVDEKVWCEVDPTRVEKKDQLKSNWSKLNGYAIAIWNSIEESKTAIPREMRILFNYIQKRVTDKYDTLNSKLQMVRFTSVSGFLFLRLFCPCILNPKLFGLTKDYADNKTSRTLTLLAKTLQCLANLASFGVKEPYMVDMNGFIMDHVNSLMEFIDHICTESSNTTPIMSTVAHDLELHMSQLNRMIRNMIHQQAFKEREPIPGIIGSEDHNVPKIPPRTTSRTMEIATSQIEELIASKLL